ncbi:MAG: AIPR family protein [Gordonia amarae]
MPSPEDVLLDQLLKSRQAERSTPIKDDTAFEIFCCEQALHLHDLSPDEIVAGVVGEGMDGGIDGLYVFLNDVLLAEDSEVFDEGFKPSSISSGARLELQIVQAKRENSFSETAIQKVSSTCADILKLDADIESLRVLYNAEIVSRSGLFREVLLRLASRHPTVSIVFSYASKGQATEVNERVRARATTLEAQFARIITGAKGSVEFLGSAELYKRSNTRSSPTLELRFQEDLTSSSSHLTLVSLKDYIDFLSDENGKLHKEIFDWNVRDYQRGVEVNREIEQSLANPSAPEFWWLNNGVTIVCTKATRIGKTYALDDVQIVNGLQTSYTVHNSRGVIEADERIASKAVTVRILIISNDDHESRDRVIRATNRQTAVPAASLRATDAIQRHIEDYFLSQGWFYDRRKNYYRNAGKSIERIVSIPLLAQVVMATGLSRPDDARARPSSLLKRDEEYGKIFSERTPIEVYLWVARVQKYVDEFLASPIAEAAAQERTNVRFHLSMVVVARMYGKRVHSPSELRMLAEKGALPSSDLVSECLAQVRESLIEFRSDGGQSDDRISKGPLFVEYLSKRLHGTESVK